MRRSFSALAAQQRALERAHNAALRELQSAAKRAERQAAHDYSASREAQAAEETQDIQQFEHELRSILSDAGAKPLDFAALKVKAKPPVFQSLGNDVPGTSPELVLPPPIAFWRKLFPQLVEQYNKQ